MLLVVVAAAAAAAAVSLYTTQPEWVEYIGKRELRRCNIRSQCVSTETLYAERKWYLCVIACCLAFWSNHTWTMYSPVLYCAKYNNNHILSFYVRIECILVAYKLKHLRTLLHRPFGRFEHSFDYLQAEPWPYHQYYFLCSFLTKYATSMLNELSIAWVGSITLRWKIVQLNGPCKVGNFSTIF